MFLTVLQLAHVYFIFEGIPCPDLHVPANGALVCSKEFCVPQCQQGLIQRPPDNVFHNPHIYYCTVQGEWKPLEPAADCNGER